MADKLDLKHLNKELEIIGVESVNYLRQILAENNKYATGELISSLDFEIVKELDGLMLKIIASEQFKYVDAGRRPGAKPPPTNNIKSWIKDKGIPFKKIEQTAFVIARSIGRKGIKPLNLKSKMTNNIIDKKVELLRNATQEDIQDLINKIFITKK